MYLQKEFSEEEWAQLEEAASCAKVLKVEVNVGGSDRCARTLAAGLVKNKALREVKLYWVPKEEHESLRGILCLNSELTVFISETL